jgi:outer membrane autotransporter protein
MASRKVRIWTIALVMLSGSLASAEITAWTGSNFELASGSTLRIEVDSAGNFDSYRIIDDTNANLVTGGKIMAIAIGNAPDGSYNIITLDGLGSIQVDGVAQAPAADLSAFIQNTQLATITALVVDGTGKIVVMDVDFQSTNADFIAGTGTPSAINLASLIDSGAFVASDELTLLIGQAQTAGSGSASDVGGAYAQMTNQLQTSASSVAAGVISSVNNNLGRHMQNARRTARNNGAGLSSNTMLASLSPMHDKSGSDGWSGFFEGYGSWGDRENDGSQIGYDYDTYGALLGAEKFMRYDLLVGGSIGYGRTNVESNDGLSGLDVDSLSASLYGTWFDNDHYISLMFGYGYHSYDSVVFAAPPLRAKGDFEAHTFTLAPEVGKLFRWGRLDLEPFAGMRYTHFRQEGYTEKGAGAANLTVGRDTDDQLSTELGVRFRTTISLDNGSQLTPQLKLAWIHDFSDEVETTARLTGANTAFRTTGIDVVSDIFNIGLGLNWRMDSSKTLYTEYDAELGSGYEAHTLQAGIRILF